MNIRSTLTAGFFVLAALLAHGILQREAVTVNAAGRSQTPAAAPAPEKHPAHLDQLMKGILLPNSNLLFVAGDKNPADIPPAKNASAAINPLEGPYGQWQAVENSALAIAETASLLTVPNRSCSNGRPVPVNNADWAGLAEGLRAASMSAYAAAKSKNQDKLGDATDAVAAACSKCHTKYRDTDKLENRCR